MTDKNRKHVLLERKHVIDSLKDARSKIANAAKAIEALHANNAEYGPLIEAKAAGLNAHSQLELALNHFKAATEEQKQLFPEDATQLKTLVESALGNARKMSWAFTKSVADFITKHDAMVDGKAISAYEQKLSNASGILSRLDGQIKRYISSSQSQEPERW